MASLDSRIDEWEIVLNLMSDEDIGDDDARVIELLEKAEADIKNKMDGYCDVIRRFKDYGTEAEHEAQRYAARAAMWKKKHESLKARLKLALERMGERQIVTAKNTVTICGNGGQQPLEITGHVPEEFQKTITKVVDDTDRIRLALASGELPFARLKDRGSHLRLS